MRGMSVMLRRLVPCVAGRSCGNLILSSAAAAAAVILAEAQQPLFISSGHAAAFQPGFLLSHSRTCSSAASSDSSKVVLIESEAQFNDSLRKVQDESLPAIFYFTAAWCGPCKLLSPILRQLSEKYPNVTTYKIDIDKEELRNTLREQNIYSVPTLHFFQNGKQASEVIGADVQRLKDTMEELYK